VSNVNSDHVRFYVSFQNEQFSRIYAYKVRLFYFFSTRDFYYFYLITHCSLDSSIRHFPHPPTEYSNRLVYVFAWKAKKKVNIQVYILKYHENWNTRGPMEIFFIHTDEYEKTFRYCTRVHNVINIYGRWLLYYTRDRQSKMVLYLPIQCNGRAVTDSLTIYIYICLPSSARLQSI